MRKAAILAMAALGACNFAPGHRPPVAPIAPKFPEQPADGHWLATEVGWHEFFGDPQLQTLIAAALERNRDLAQAAARIAQTRAQYHIQDAARLPDVDLQTAGARTRTPLSLSGVGNTGGSSDAEPSAVTYDQYSLGVSVPAFELDFWGRVRNLSDAARARYLATVEAEQAFRLSLIGQVAATYYAIRASEERIALADRTVKSRREGLRIARLRMDAGVTSTVDFDQANLLVTQAETELADLQRIVEQANNLLTLLIGGPISAPLPAPRPIADAEQIADLRSGLPSDLLAHRPDIRQAEMELRAANADIGAARAAFFPNISLTGNYGWASTDLGDLITSGFRAWTFGSAINLPLLDWGRRSAELKFTEAKADELAAAYQRTVQQAFREVADGLVGRRRYAEQIKAQHRAVETQRRLARSARLRYDNGIAIYLEVLDAERNLFTAEQQLLALQAAELQNGVSLYIALGGGAELTDRLDSKHAKLK